MVHGWLVFRPALTQRYAYQCQKSSVIVRTHALVRRVIRRYGIFHDFRAVLVPFRLEESCERVCRQLQSLCH